MGEALGRAVLAAKRHTPEPVWTAARGGWHRARRVAEQLPRRGDTPAVTVSVYCIYRAANSAHVLALIDALGPEAAVHLHALDEPHPTLQAWTRSSGAGMRMPLLQKLIDAHPPRPGEALLIADDDVEFRDHRGGRFPAYAAAAGLDVAQPAHIHMQRHTFAFNTFHYLATARLTGFVEIGPLVYLSARAQARVLPFPPDAGMGWGLDVAWSRLPGEGLRLGVVDATPMVHFGEVGAAYDSGSEFARLQEQLRLRGVEHVNDVARELGPVWRPWARRAPWQVRPGSAHPAGGIPAPDVGSPETVAPVSSSTAVQSPAPATRRPRLHAYVLAADPAWAALSLRSYYDLVERIVVSFDETGTSWTGRARDPSRALAVLQGADPDGKIVLAPGRFYDPTRTPLDNDTAQRQAALELASEGADWVVQLDTDEVLAGSAAFLECLLEADSLGYAALDYPARYLYQHAGGDRYLERTRRLGRVAAAYPGPVAVRSGTVLRLSRQTHVPAFRVDFAAHNTDPWHPRSAPVHRVVGSGEGILHFSWVRSEQEMAAKTTSWGHAGEREWGPELARWQRAGRHPWRAMLGGLVSRDQDRWLRVTRLPNGPDAHARRAQGLAD